MARTKKIKVEETAPEEKKVQVVTPPTIAPKLDPSIPENKQRDLR